MLWWRQNNTATAAVSLWCRLLRLSMALPCGSPAPGADAATQLLTLKKLLVCTPAQQTHSHGQAGCRCTFMETTPPQRFHHVCRGAAFQLTDEVGVMNGHPVDDCCQSMLQHLLLPCPALHMSVSQRSVDYLLFCLSCSSNWCT